MTEPITPPSGKSVTTTQEAHKTEGTPSRVNLGTESVSKTAEAANNVYEGTPKAGTVGGSGSLGKTGVTTAGGETNPKTEEAVGKRDPLKGEFSKKESTKTKLSPEERAQNRENRKAALMQAGAATRSARETFREGIAKELEKMDAEGGLSGTIVGQEFIKEAERSMGSFPSEVPSPKVKDGSTTKEESEVEPPKSASPGFVDHQEKFKGTLAEIEKKPSLRNSTATADGSAPNVLSEEATKSAQKATGRHQDAKTTAAKQQEAERKLAEENAAISQQQDRQKT